MITGTLMASPFLGKSGVQLDAEQKKFRRYTKVLGMFTFFGKWNRLMKIDYVLLFRTLYAKCEACTPEDFEKSSVVQLSLVYNKNRRLIIHETNDLKDVKETAIKLARDLSVSLRDSATDRRNPVWIKNPTQK